MIDLLVIGGGYWGIATALRAYAQRLDFQVWDSRDLRGASRNASGIAHRQIYRSPLFRDLMPADWTDGDLDESFDWLQRVGGAVRTVENFQNCDRMDLGVRTLDRGALYLRNNDTFLGKVPTHWGRVESLRFEGGGWTVEVSGYEAPGLSAVRARNVVLTAGVATDPILKASGLPTLGVQSLWGYGILVTGTATLPLPMVLQTRVYRKFEIRAWSYGSIRVGDVAAKVASPKFEEELRKVAQTAVPGFQQTGAFEGFRPVLPQFTVKLVAPGLVVATGGHRMGLGLSGLVAKKALGLLFLE